MFAAIFAIITTWAPAEPVAQPAAHITARLPALDTTGLSSSSASDSKPLVSVCTYGGRSLDGFSFARLGDLTRAVSLPACTSGFDAVQRAALAGLTLPNDPLGRAGFSPLVFTPTPWLATPHAFTAASFHPMPTSGATTFFVAPLAPRTAPRFPAASIMLSHASGSFGAEPGIASGGTTRIAPPTSLRRPLARVRR